MSEIIISICEDNQQDADQFIRYLNQAGTDLNVTVHITHYPDGVSFLNHFNSAVGIVFLDVNLPDMSGGDIAAEIRRRDPQVYLVFISQYTETISIGYEFEAKNYLLKPFHYHSICAELQRYIRIENTMPKPYFLLGHKDAVQKVYYSKLYYIEKQNRKLVFHYDGQTFAHTGNLSDYEQLLPQPMFYRSCNSHIVNLQFVSTLIPDINRYSIKLVTGEIIPLSRDRKKDFLHQLQNLGDKL